MPLPPNKKPMEAAEQPLSRPKDVTLPSSGPLNQKVSLEEESVVETVSETLAINRKLEMMAFMEEPITIIIHETTDKNAEKHIFLQVNGQGAGPNGFPFVPRGREVTIKRKFVAVLAQARPVAVWTEETTDRDGYRASLIKRSSALAFPFRVVRDDNPRGAAWLLAKLGTTT